MSVEVTNISTSWHSYPSPKVVGHAMIRDLLSDPVIVEEKIDGSQFSFGVFDGELKCRSKGAQLNLFAPEKMFLNGIESVKELQPLLKEGWTYRCEYLQRPKHNVLAYSRVPNKHIIILDINDGHETYLSYSDKAAEANRIGLEVTPLLFEGVITEPQTIRDFMGRKSVLGGAKIEGVVIKNYKRFTMDGKVQMGKFVAEEFKEIHNGDWRERHPKGNDIVQVLSDKFKSPARWNKAIIHLKERGLIKNEMSDLQHLFPEVVRDVKEECEAEIKDVLFEWAWENISRAVTGGLPQFYEEKLMKESLEK